MDVKDLSAASFRYTKELHPLVKGVRPRMWRQAMSSVLWDWDVHQRRIKELAKIIEDYSEKNITLIKTRDDARTALVKYVEQADSERQEHHAMVEKGDQKIEDLQNLIAEYSTYNKRRALELERLREQADGVPALQEQLTKYGERIDTLADERKALTQQVFELKARMFDLLEARGLI
jgi:uncharacterized coiled-coil DUF342 family protein